MDQSSTNNSKLLHCNNGDRGNSSLLECDSSLFMGAAAAAATTGSCVAEASSNDDGGGVYSNAAKKCSKKRASPATIISDEKVPSLLEASFSSDDSGRQVLSWRLNPNTSHSDWVIDVTVISASGGYITEESTKTYHVHKAALSVGPRKSEFFARCFQTANLHHVGNRRSGRKKNSDDEPPSRTDLTLSVLEGQAVAPLLDYIYSGKLDISTQNAAPLYTLSKILEVKKLTAESKQFWAKDLSVATAGTYFRHAKTLEDEAGGIHKAVMKLCTKNPNILLDLKDSDFFLEVLDSMDSTAKADEFAPVIASFCQATTSRLNISTYLRLTTLIRHHGTIENAQAALTLLKVQHALIEREVANNAGDLDQTIRARLHEMAILLVDAMAGKGWLTDGEDPAVATILAASSQQLRERYLESCLSQARSEFQTFQNSRAQLKVMADQNRQLRAENERLQSALHEMGKRSNQRSVVERIVSTLADRFPLLTCYSHRKEVYEEAEFLPL